MDHGHSSDRSPGRVVEQVVDVLVSRAVKRSLKRSWSFPGTVFSLLKGIHSGFPSVALLRAKGLHVPCDASLQDFFKRNQQQRMRSGPVQHLRCVAHEAWHRSVACQPM